MEIVWLVGLYKELDVSVHLPVSFSCDSKFMLQIAANLVFHERTKHINIDCHFFQEKVHHDLVVLSYLPSSE